jgi:hypothetical protein
VLSVAASMLDMAITKTKEMSKKYFLKHAMRHESPSFSKIDKGKAQQNGFCRITRTIEMKMLPYYREKTCVVSAYRGST